uniref:TOG domain-containing protein n=1 Tax=Rhabditophanes sp. KR3021 TaxID=114890 RepID=A0AC35TKU5_9BILA
MASKERTMTAVEKAVIENLMAVVNKQKPAGKAPLPTLTNALLNSALFGMISYPHEGRVAIKKGLAQLVKEGSFGVANTALTVLLENIENNNFVDTHNRIMAKVFPGKEKAIAINVYISGVRSLFPEPTEDFRLAAGFNAFLLNSLLVCSTEPVFQARPSMWAEMVEGFDKTHQILNSGIFKKLLAEKLFSYPSLQIKENAVKLLVSLDYGKHEIAAFVWKNFEDYFVGFDKEPYFDISEEQFKIYKTAEGVLWNESVIDEDLSIYTRNMSKKDAAVEIQLRKEIAERKKREGKFSPQQIKAMEEEKAYESRIRKEITALHNKVHDPFKMMIAAAGANPTEVTKHFNLMYEIVVPLTKAELVAPIAAQTFLAFRDAVFEPTADYLHELAAQTTLRYVGSKKVYKEWCEESLELQLQRMIASLQSMCAVFDCPEDLVVDDLFMEKEGMNASKIGFLLPLIELILTKDKTEIRTALTNFLQEGVSTKFIKGEDVMTVPYLELASMIMPILISSGDPELTNPCMKVLKNLGNIMSECTIPSGKMEAFVVFILDHLKNNNETIRLMIIEMLYEMHHQVSVMMSRSKSFKAQLIVRLAVAINDKVEEVQGAALQLWNHLELALPVSLFDLFFNEFMDRSKFVRESASSVLLKICMDKPELKADITKTLFDLFEFHSSIVPAKFNNVGRLIEKEVDNWEKRSGIASSLTLLIETITLEESLDMLMKTIDLGLNDYNVSVRQQMLKAAEKIICKYGVANMNKFLPYLEKKLSGLSNSAADDITRQGLVILVGTLAKYLDDNDKIMDVLMKLMSILTTPSQPVQESVCACLPSLVQKVPEDAKELLKGLLNNSSSFKTYGERRGTAYGIGGIVKGLGIRCIKDLEVDLFLKKGLNSKKNAVERETCCLIMEMLGHTLGQAFEPYLLTLLPDLLLVYGDAVENVRLAGEDACGVVMSKISIFGSKLVLPAIIKAIDQDIWRTKVVCAKLLGSMAITAPKQLSVCLPLVVPKLIECLADSHNKVQAASEKALKQIAGVIKNPEMFTISSHLIDALVDPGNKTVSTLTTILNIRFAHFIDTPSLSMIMPIVRRGFDEKSTEGRRMSANIIANIYQLADKRDMEPYLYDVMPGLKKSLLDPVPDVRAVSAKAIGSIIKHASGESSQKLQLELLPWLREKLISPDSVVERSGAAQGLSEIYYGLGEDTLEDIMPQIIKTTERTELAPHIRDGFILMYIHLPIVFKDRFVPFLPKVIPSILKGLSDENEFVRDSSLKAGQKLITQFVASAQTLLLPQLQKAIIDNFWRIRHAAVLLIGDFLFTVSGVTGKSTSNTIEEDDNIGVDGSNNKIIEALGQATRDDIFSALYLCRNDAAGQVRVAATHVWKIVVANTPRTLKEIMVPMFTQLLACLSSDSEDRQIMANKCLGDLVKKLGEKVMTDVLPVLEQGLESENWLQRQGVAIALYEIIENTSSEVILIYMENLVNPIKKVLSDVNQEVRTAAINVFRSFYKLVGNVALDEIVVHLLKDIEDEEKADRVIDGLCVVVQSNSRQMMAYLLPKLTKPPVNVNALCRIAAAAGDSLGNNLPRILDALLDNCANNDSEKQIENCLPVLISVGDENGIEVIISTLLTRATKKDHIPSMILLSRFIAEADIDFTDRIDVILPGTIALYNSNVPEIVEAAIRTMAALTKDMEQADQFATMPVLQSAVGKFVYIGKCKPVTGFCHPKGIAPLLPMIRESIINGSVDVKQKACETLGNMITLSNEEGLKAHVVSATGPLIRVLGDRYPSEVKIAVLSTLSKLLDKVINMLRAFLPQLQSTFLKAIQEPSSKQVRTVAGAGLLKLVAIHPKPEMIVNEYVKILNALDDETLLETTIASLKTLIEAVGPKLGGESKDAVSAIGQKYNVKFLF